MRNSLVASWRCFIADETGGGTVTALFFFTASMALGGLAIDGANGYRERAQLQAVTDAVSLAAAAHVDDTTTGRSLAADIAERNLGPNYRDLIRDEDIVYGIWDAASRTFTPTLSEPNAVVVSANRRETRGTGLTTYILGLVGIDSWDVSVSSFAARAGVGEAGGPYCNNATVVTTGRLQLGGSNHFEGKVCLHGELGVQGGGSNYYGPGVRLSAANEDDIIGGHTTIDSASGKSIIVVRSLEPQIVPDLPYMLHDLMQELQSRDGEAYSGTLLPKSFSGAKIVELKKNHVNFTDKVPDWSKDGQEVAPEPNTIYVTSGSVQFTGNVQASDIAIIAGNQIGVGGGNDLAFENVYFFADKQVNLAGDIKWGNAETFCDTGLFNSYLLSGSKVSFGGSSGGYGILAAAPTVSTGGSFTGVGGLYIEADENTTNLGGNANISVGCDLPLDSEILDIVKPLGAAEDTASGVRSILVK